MMNKKELQMMNKKEFTDNLINGLSDLQFVYGRNESIMPIIKKHKKLNNMDQLISVFAENMSCYWCPFCGNICKLTEKTQKNCRKFLLKQYNEIMKGE